MHKYCPSELQLLGQTRQANTYKRTKCRHQEQGGLETRREVSSSALEGRGEDEEEI